MKKLLLIFVVMVAFATGSSYAYTQQYSDQYRAWVYAEHDQISLSVTLPSGYGYTSIWFIMTNTSDNSAAYGSTAGSDGNAYLYGSGYNAVNVHYIAGAYLHLSAYASGEGSSNIAAYYTY